MPQLGDTQIANRNRYIWNACPDCGKEHWVSLIRGRQKYERCKACASRFSHSTRDHSYIGEGPTHGSWRGGRGKNGKYLRVWVGRNSSFYPMTDKHSYILEHRLVMAKYLGRCLHSSELVHHKNGDKTDNRLENLELVSHLQNLAYEKMCHNCELKKELRLLRWQIKELSKQLQEKLCNFP